MASGSEAERDSQLRIHAPRPRHRTSPYPSNPPTPSRNTPTGSRSTSVRASSSVDIRPEQPTTSSLLPAELTQLKDVLKDDLKSFEVRLTGLPQLQSVVRKLEKCLDYMPVYPGIHLLPRPLEKINQVRMQTQCKYGELIRELTNLIPLLWKPFIDSNPRKVPAEILEVVKTIETQINRIEDLQSRSKGNQTMREEDRDVLVQDCFQGVRKQFGRLPDEIKAWGEKREQWLDAHLKDLIPTREAYYNAALSITVAKRVGCTENTRVGLLDDTRTWTQDKDGAKIFWLNGMAGTGKTTLAYTMCDILHKDGLFAASYFCSRNSLECRDVNRIVPTIAYQLGQHGRCPDSYRHRLCTVLEEDVDVAMRDISVQFKNLILKPLLAIGEAMPNNMVVVIDALDECTNVHGAEVMLNMLLQYAENLPLKFFVASRPEPAIIQRMVTGDGAMRSILWLHDIDESLVQADIRTYLAKALQTVQATPSELDALAERAGCLFIFAATAVRYILPERRAVNHRRRLQAVLNLRPRQGSKSYKDIDDLYATILTNALDEEVFEVEELTTRRRVLWTVACASEPMTIPAIAGLLSLPDTETVEVAIDPLQSVLRISETTSIVSILHSSFPDFLLSEERAGQFHCNEGLQDTYLAECCFRVMDRSLMFNICGLESSHTLDQDVPDLQERVDRVISNELFYACRYWGGHLARCPPSPSLLNLLGSFMDQHFLFWIEVLNLKKHIGYGSGVLGQALAWLLVSRKFPGGGCQAAADELQLEGDSTNLQHCINDARNFIVSFASSPTSLSTPHIYISSLPFTPKQSRVWAIYWPQMRGLIRIETQSQDRSRKFALKTWVVGEPVRAFAQSSDGRCIASASGSEGLIGGAPLHCMSIWDASSGARILRPLNGQQGPILSVAFSPNYTCIASSSKNHTICIWNTSDSRLIAGPLHGHTRAINSISFSLDGACLASGADDHTIRMWNTHSGTPLGEPLKGHQGGVTSVVFSSGGEHLASGSRDFSVRVWDLRTQILVQELFTGHTQSVGSVSYSPDSLCLATGSDDHTVRILEVSSGKLLVDPLRGHADAVTSVSFSPSGSLIVSGSCDKTIRVWETGSGMLVSGPFEGHDGCINSVLFCANGSTILSGSDDGTIRLWDALAGTADITEPSGHTGSIHSFVLSPDGIRAISSSYDNSICVWDAHTAEILVGPLIGHTNWVNSVALSPDGQRIVSGSQDHTLRIWGAHTGTLLVGPFEGHTNPVMTVSFSPDAFKGHTSKVTSIAFSPDGTRLVSGSYDKTIRMWDANDGSSPLWVSHMHTSKIRCVAFSPDEVQVVFGSWDGAIVALDASNGAVLIGSFMGHHSGILSVAFSPDARHVVSGSYDKMVRVWDARSGKAVAYPFSGHTGGVTSVGFSPDGARVISGSVDGTIRLWDVGEANRPDTVFHQSSSMDSNGWLINSKSQRLFWIPTKQRKEFSLRSRFNSVIIGKGYSVIMDNSILYLGDEWHKCCRSTVPSAI